MKEKKSKWMAFIGGAGALCVLCCSLPIFGLLGLGAVEAYFCENEKLQGMGFTLIAGAITYFAWNAYKRAKNQNRACDLSCGCRAS